MFDNAGLCYILTFAYLKKKSSLWFLVVVLFTIRESSVWVLIRFLVVVTLGFEAADLYCLSSVEDLKKESIANLIVFVKESLRRSIKTLQVFSSFVTRLTAWLTHYSFATPVPIPFPCFVILLLSLSHLHFLLPPSFIVCVILFSYPLTSPHIPAKYYT